MTSPFTFVTNKPASSDPINQGPALFQAQWGAIKSVLGTLLPTTVSGTPTIGWRVLQDGNDILVGNNVATWDPGVSISQDDTSLHSWAVQLNTDTNAPHLFYANPGNTTLNDDGPIISSPNRNFSTVGYEWLNDGFILNWGIATGLSFTGPGNSSVNTSTFSKTFPTACQFIMVVPFINSGVGGWSLYEPSPTTTVVNVQIYSGVSSTIDWGYTFIAIGN